MEGLSEVLFFTSNINEPPLPAAGTACTSPSTSGPH